MFITRFAAAAMIAVAAGVGLPAGAVAAPKNYCTELKWRVALVGSGGPSCW